MERVRGIDQLDAQYNMHEMLGYDGRYVPWSAVDVNGADAVRRRVARVRAFFD